MTTLRIQTVTDNIAIGIGTFSGRVRPSLYVETEVGCCLILATFTSSMHAKQFEGVLTQLADILDRGRAESAEPTEEGNE